MRKTSEEYKEDRLQGDLEYPSEQVDNFFRSINKKRKFTFFSKAKIAYLRPIFQSSPTMTATRWHLSVDGNITVRILTIGVHMEDAKNMLHAVDDEVKESLKILEDLSNQCMTVAAVVGPRLQKQITDLRDHRMALVSELRQCLNMMQDVRKFFFEADYEKEMERLERFIKACKDMKQLREDGTLDAICDASIRLAVQEKK